MTIVDLEHHGEQTIEIPEFQAARILPHACRGCPRQGVVPGDARFRAASISLSRPVPPRRERQPIFVRGELDFKGGGHLRTQVAHDTTHIDMPVHFLEGAADLDDVLYNPAYRLSCIQGEWRGWLRAAVGASPIPPLPPGEGRVRAKQSQGERLRFLDCHTLIWTLL